MVLVLAALYTYARYNNHDITAACLPEGGTSSSLDDSSNSISNNDQQQQQQSHRRRLRRLQRRVSDTFQSARHQTNSLLHTTVGRCHQGSSSASSFGTNTTAAAESSSLYASIPLQGSSSYSLLADHHHPHHSVDRSMDMTSTTPADADSTSMINTTAGGRTTNSIPVEDVSLNMFPQAVREEWINAVFGPDFCKNHPNNNNSQQQHTTTLTPRHGVGHAGIASYTSYTTTIPIQQQHQQHGNNNSATIPPPPTKVGITVSRLPLGLYVRRVAPNSEAALLGVQVGDVLVSLNGLIVLAEPSRPLLERLWQYEGVVNSNFSKSCSDVATTSEASTSNNTSRHSQQGSSVARAESKSATAAAVVVVDNGNSNNNSPCNTTTSSSRCGNTMTDPVAMTFSRHGQLYQVLFLSSGSSCSSSWGMAWGPCGNFPLVKRSYSLAAAAGVQRGSILASVNGTSFRELDHYGMAMKLSNDFQSAAACQQQDLHLTLCFPPRTARPQRSSSNVVHSSSSSHSPQPAVNGNNNNAITTSNSGSSTAPQNRPLLSSYNNTSLSRKRATPQPKRVVRMDDGVEIKFHSLGFAIGGICSAAVGAVAAGGGNFTSSSSPSRGRSGSSSINNSSISDLAEKVAAGAVESPFVKDITHFMCSSSSSSSRPLYSPCPTLQGKELLDAWNPIESLLYCCAFFKAGYQEDAVQDFLNDNQARVVVHHDDESNTNSSSSSSSRAIAALHTLTNTPHAASMASAFLLQFISVICFPSSSSSSTHQQFLGTSSAPMEEKKSDDLLVHDEESETNNKNHNNEDNAKELTSMLLKLSRRDEGFCQRLYFLLRSYISSIETKRITTTATTGGGGSNKDGSSTTHLMALLNCLELLRFAEKQLAGAHLHQNNNNKQHVPIQKSLSLSPTSKKTTAMESPIPSAVPASPASSASIEEATAAVNKKKSVLHFLRKKKPSTNKPGGSFSKMHPSNTTNKISMISPLGDHVAQEMPLTSNTTSAVVTPTLSQQQQQQQQYSMSSIMSDDNVSLSQSPSVMYENMSDFLSQLDQVCSTIERSLQRSFRQKIADWAMQPWSASKDTALASVTSVMRQSLKQAINNSDSQRMKLLVNPVESSELLSSVDSDECYILPSAHFPILLTFNVSERRRSCDYSSAGEERIYRTTVKLRGLNSNGGSLKLKSGSYTVHAAVAGKILASDESISIDNTATKHTWRSGNNSTLVFDTRSSWGAPQTLSLRLSSTLLANPTGAAPVEDATFGWVDLSQLWKKCDTSISGGSKSVKCQVNMLSLEARDEMFDEHGESSDQEHEEQQQANRVELELEVSTEFVDFGDSSNGDFSRKRMLLYKHDDDLRQEDFAVQFIRTCDNILKASGLDMKLLTFQCIPVGTRRGFVEWVPGSVPLSEVCQPFLDSLLESSENKTSASDDGRSSPSMFAKAGLTKYESLFRLGGSLQSESLRRLAGAATAAAFEKPGSFANNPVQDYLRSVAYAEDAPYLIRRDVMDTYVKSCAGYSVITYILGVGDRHLDNLLLHQSGSFFHCDYSFLLGSDPKKYLPMRITEDMVNGMGGRSSDNYAKFLSLTSAAFLALRRPEIVRILLSMVRLTECSNLPNMSENQSIDQAVLGLRDRLRLDLREDEAVAFMENLIEDSLNSKIWLAVDAIHSLGKKF